MKRIIAVIRQEKFESVKKALIDAGCEGMNVSEVKGRGRQMGIRESYRGSSYCKDLERILDVIVESAHTGEVGDGKIFVSDVAEVIRIRTGERGSDAV